MRSGLGAWTSRTTATIRMTKTRATHPQMVNGLIRSKWWAVTIRIGAEQGRQRVHLAPQHLGHLAGQDVADDAAADGGDAPDERPR